jgi:hypothetical protein
LINLLQNRVARIDEEEMSNFSWREERALRAFEKEVVLRYYDLPRGVGRDTMRVLIAKGLVELVDKSIGEFAKDRRWRRTRMARPFLVGSIPLGAVSATASEVQESQPVHTARQAEEIAARHSPPNTPDSDPKNWLASFDAKSKVWTACATPHIVGNQRLHSRAGLLPADGRA